MFKSAMVFALTLVGFSAQAQQEMQWMHKDVAQAWSSGYRGQGTTIQVIDSYLPRSGNFLVGNLGNGTYIGSHGAWTLYQTALIAPSAKKIAVDFSNTRAVSLSRGMNVLNLSYGMFATDGYAARQIRWSEREGSVIQHAQNGAAIVVKAAGNDRIAVNTVTAAGSTDYLNRALTGAPAAIFVGALEQNGSLSVPAKMASYSNFAGADPLAQRNFLVVGVEGDKTGLYGTSFAAPIVSGYAAIVSSKFTKASPTQVVSQLLNTARQDTVADYDPAVHGRGEASLQRALAPRTIN